METAVDLLYGNLSNESLVTLGHTEGRKGSMRYLIAATMLAFAGTAAAATWTVDDDGQDTPNADFTAIQPAIDASSNFDSIVVYPGTYTGSGQYVVDLQDKDITLTSIEILGGASVTFIDGQSQRGGLKCGSGTTSLTQIYGFTIQNCLVSADAAHGAGIYCEGSPTTSNCTISGNKVIGQNDFVDNAVYARGGGIFIANGSIVASPWFEYCTISNNQATANWDEYRVIADGGGVYIGSGCSATFEHCMVSGNLTESLVPGTVRASRGGGIYNEGTGVSLLDCTITTNTASSVPGDGDGGGVFCYIGGDITLTDCTIQSNQSTNSGGGLGSNSGGITLVNCDVSYNTTGNSGGGLKARGHGHVLQITGGSFIGNATTIGGGGGIAIGQGSIVALEQSSIHNVNISGNQSAGPGGGLHYVILNTLAVGPHVLSNCTVAGNTAAHGGGISCQGAGSILQLLIQNCQIGQNLAYGGSGGGLNIASCNPEIAYCDISDNSTTHFGGGLYGSESSKPTILDTTINGNSGFGGGGMYVDASEAPDTEFSLTAVVLCGNTPNQACGPWVDDGVCLVQSCDGLNNPSSPTACGCPADFNTDNKVDSTDLQQVIANMGDEGGVSDIAADCGVNILDLLDVLSQWGPCS